jgi:hypothetical protein
VLCVADAMTISCEVWLRGAEDAFAETSGGVTACEALYGLEEAGRPLDSWGQGILWSCKKRVRIAGQSGWVVTI